MLNQAPVLENDTHKLLWDFIIQSPNLGQKTKHNNSQQKEQKKIIDFAVPADHRIKPKESEKKNKYLNLARHLKKTMELESDDYNNRYWCFWYSHQTLIKGTEGLGNKRTRRDQQNYYSIENGHNTEKSPGDLSIFAVSQTPVKVYQLTLM